MQLKFRPWHIAALMITFCVIVVLGLFYYRSKTGLTTAQVFRYVPAGPGLLVHVDVAALRSAGVVSLLSGSKVTEDPEYRTFVEQTRFDYQTDLDTLTAGFYGPESFYIIQGRFDWKAMKSYATASGGSCWDAFCTVPATKKDHYISFLPVRPDLMMLAVSMENKAVKRMLARPRRSSSDPIPDQPVWVSIPPSVLQKPETFPAGTQLFAKALQNSDTVTLSVGPNGQSFRAMLSVTCRSAEEAVLLEAQFEKVTEVLRKLIAANQQQPNPKDLSGVLTSGAFRREDRRVLGNWPIEKAFLENMVGGTF